MLTYYKFNHDNQLTNIVAGHHQWDEGIKSIEEINALYDCPKIEVKAGVYIRTARKKGLHNLLVGQTLITFAK